MCSAGFLFGLGFDTATEVELLAIVAAQTAAGLWPCSLLVFPALFTAGMPMVDTADIQLMVRAYGWAGVDPGRKILYNLTITGSTLAVALSIGGIKVLVEAFHLDNMFWRAIATLNSNPPALVVALVLLFAACWATSVVKSRRTVAAAG